MQSFEVLHYKSAETSLSYEELAAKAGKYIERQINSLAGNITQLQNELSCLAPTSTQSKNIFHFVAKILVANMSWSTGSDVQPTQQQELQMRLDGLVGLSGYLKKLAAHLVTEQAELNELLKESGYWTLVTLLSVKSHLYMPHHTGQDSLLSKKIHLLQESKDLFVKNKSFLRFSQGLEMEGLRQNVELAYIMVEFYLYKVAQVVEERIAREESKFVDAVLVQLSHTTPLFPELLKVLTGETVSQIAVVMRAELTDKTADYTVYPWYKHLLSIVYQQIRKELALARTQAQFSSISIQFLQSLLVEMWADSRHLLHDLDEGNFLENQYLTDLLVVLADQVVRTYLTRGFEQIMQELNESVEESAADVFATSSVAILENQG